MKAIVLGFGLTVFGAGLALAAGGDTVDSLQRSPGGVTVAQNSCPSGTMVCGAGALGPGGCYNPGYARCWQGMVCRAGESICTVDKNTNARVPSCYNAALPNTCRQ